MTLIEPPIAHDRDPRTASLSQRDVGRGDRTREQGGVDHVGEDAGLGEHSTTACRSSRPLSESPTSTQPVKRLRRSLALAMAQEYEV